VSKSNELVINMHFDEKTAYITTIVKTTAQFKLTKFTYRKCSLLPLGTIRNE